MNDAFDIDGDCKYKSSTMHSEKLMVDLFRNNHYSYEVDKEKFNKGEGQPIIWFYVKLDDPMMVNGVGF